MKEVQCKRCRYLLKDKDGYNWCPNKLDDPDVDLLRDCEWFAGNTNADRIRSMTDEGLADELLEWYAVFSAVEWTKDMILDWLKKEVSD